MKQKIIALFLFTLIIRISGSTFSVKPGLLESNGKTFVTFTVSSPTDVEVAIIDKNGKVVRHLAAGVIGGEFTPPAPLEPGLSQSIEWNGLDDYGHVIWTGPFMARVRLGVSLEFEKRISSRVYDPKWNVYHHVDTTKVYPNNLGIDSIVSMDTLIPTTHPVWRFAGGYHGFPDTFPCGTKKIKFYESFTKFDMTVSKKDDRIVIQNHRSLATAAPMALIDGITGQTIKILPPYGKSSSLIRSTYYPDPIGAEYPAAMFAYAEPNFDWYGNYIYHDEGGPCNHLYRFNVDGEPAPFSSGPYAGTHAIAQTKHTGSDLRQRGIASGPDGSIYHAHSASAFDSANTKGGSWYYVSKYDSNGVLKNDSLLKIYGNIGQGIRIDLKGNIFAGIRVRPFPDSVPSSIRSSLDGLPSDKYSQNYWARVVYGSIAKFGPDGGVVIPDATGPLMGGPSAQRARAERMIWMHYGASFQPSHVTYVGATCICYAPRFDVDLYGRVIFPNGFENEFKALDNNGNLIFRIHNRDLMNDVKIGMIHVVQATDRAVYLADHINNQIICLTWKAESEDTLLIPTLSVDKLISPPRLLSISSQPNPFNPLTIIHINGLQSAELRSAILAVYDTQGKRVTDLTLSIRPDNSSIKWMARDASGQSLPSGIYYLRLTTSDHKTITRPLVLMK